MFFTVHSEGYHSNCCGLIQLKNGFYLFLRISICRLCKNNLLVSKKNSRTLEEKTLHKLFCHDSYLALAEEDDVPIPNPTHGARRGLVVLPTRETAIDKQHTDTVFDSWKNQRCGQQFSDLEPWSTLKLLFVLFSYRITAFLKCDGIHLLKNKSGERKCSLVSLVQICARGDKSGVSNKPCRLATHDRSPA